MSQERRLTRKCADASIGVRSSRSGGTGVGSGGSSTGCGLSGSGRVGGLPGGFGLPGCCASAAQFISSLAQCLLIRSARSTRSLCYQASGGCPISMTPPGSNWVLNAWHRHLIAKSKIMLGFPSAESCYSASGPRKSQHVALERGSCVVGDFVTAVNAHRPSTSSSWATSRSRLLALTQSA